jgi:formylglycine-generating enzyme required for sulfatase activity
VALFLVACGTRTTLVSQLDASADADASTPCPTSLPGPKLVPGWLVCVDATEVTNADYLAFLSDPKHGRAAFLFCPASDPLEPMFDWPPAPDRLQYPVVNVDWCGAWAYCDWAGKQLCTESLFASSCEAPDGGAFPYGATYAPRACNGIDYDAGHPLPVGSLATCEGPPGAFDMSGNVWEWLSYANPYTDGGLMVGLGGGGFRNDRYNLQCNAFFMAPPTTRYDYYGFRCCSR